MNFQTILEELDKLYEENLTNDIDTEEEVQESLVEDADEEVLIDDEPIVDDETQEEEPEVEAEEDEAEEDEAPKQVVLECSNCGALVIKNEADIKVDEESDLINVDEECQFCEEADGYKIVGALVSYEGADDVTESLTEGKIKDSLKKVATRLGANATTLIRGFADLIPSEAVWDAAEFIENKATLKALQSGNEKLLNTLTVDDIEDLKKDIEAYKNRKANKSTADDEELEEIFDAKVNLDLKNFGGTDNDVSVLGLESLDTKDSENAEELEELFDADINLDARGFGGSGNAVSVLGGGLPAREELDQEEADLGEGIFSGFGGNNKPNTIRVDNPDFSAKVARELKSKFGGEVKTFELTNGDETTIWVDTKKKFNAANKYMGKKYPSISYTTNEYDLVRNK
jgi:hypothetical protein